MYLAQFLGRCVLIALILTALAIGIAQAAPLTNLALMCKTAVKGTEVCPDSSLRWIVPTDISNVQTVAGWMTWADVPDSAQVSVCTGSINATSTLASCPADQRQRVLRCEVAGQSCTPPADASKFEASSYGGVAPVSTTLSWDVLGVDGCVASGSWTGAKAAKGSQTIAGLTASAKYTLTCSAGASKPGTASLSWKPPIDNTDGSPLTDLAGYRIVYGMNATALSSIIEIPTPSLASYKIDGLTPGTWYFAIRAYTAKAESANSAVASKVIAGSPGKQWTRTIDVAVTAPPSVPNPPTELTVTETTAYRLDQQPNAPMLVAIGTVPLGTRCYPEELLGKNRIDNATVKLAANRSRPNVALATCLPF